MPVVKGFLIRRRFPRAFCFRTLKRLLSRLPNLETYHHEPWSVETAGLSQGDALLPVLRLISLSRHLRDFRFFQNYDCTREISDPLQRGEQQSWPALGQAVLCLAARPESRLETLCITHAMDARDFLRQFSCYQASASLWWAPPSHGYFPAFDRHDAPIQHLEELPFFPRLQRLALSSVWLAPGRGRNMCVTLRAMAVATLRMPQLEIMEVWESEMPEDDCFARAERNVDGGFDFTYLSREPVPEHLWAMLLDGFRHVGANFVAQKSELRIDASYHWAELLQQLKLKDYIMDPVSQYMALDDHNGIRFDSMYYYPREIQHALNAVSYPYEFV